MPSRLTKFDELLQDMGLYHDCHPVLAQNGFDNWEAISCLNSEILKSIGITDDLTIKELLACVEAAGAIEDEQDVLNESGEGEEILKPENDLLEEVKLGEMGHSSRKSSMDIDPNRRVAVTEGMLMKGTSLKKDKKETSEKFLSKVIQLYLNEKGITHIENMNMCPQLQSLYLYNNSIQKIESLDPLVNLTTLNLQGNFIKKMQGLRGLRSLKKLNISKNLLVVIEGLENCQELEELNVSYQQTDQELMFDPTSLSMISGSLRFLEADGNRIQTTAPLAYLNNVQNLSLRSNEIREVEAIEKMLACMTNLISLDIRDNPVEKVPKVRDQVVMMSSNLISLNDKKILENERTFLLKFYNIKSAALAKGKGMGAGKDQKGPLTVAGNSIKSAGNKENMTVGSGLNKASEFHSNTVHANSKKTLYK